jgi:hypothetical protein
MNQQELTVGEAAKQQVPNFRKSLFFADSHDTSFAELCSSLAILDQYCTKIGRLARKNSTYLTQRGGALGLHVHTGVLSVLQTLPEECTISDELHQMFSSLDQYYRFYANEHSGKEVFLQIWKKGSKDRMIDLSQVENTITFVPTPFGMKFRTKKNKKPVYGQWCVELCVINPDQTLN